MGKIVLVTGGARSGKSTFAERYAAACGPSVSYIATAQALDEEMEERIARHRARRPAGWRTWEAPQGAAAVMAEAAWQADAVLFDCLTLYISNGLLAMERAGREDRIPRLLAEVRELVARARAVQPPVIFVTNEVGSGLVPDSPLGREYRDAAGLANQTVAAAADEVFLTVCGLAVDVRRLAKEVPVNGAAPQHTG